jgi:hypothetical protein
MCSNGLRRDGRTPVSPVPREGSRSGLCRRGVTALGEVGVALAFGRVDRVVVVLLDIQSADGTVHPTDNVMLPAAD